MLLQGCLLQSCLLLRGMLPARQLRDTLSKGGRLLRITVQRVREWNVAQVALEGEGLWAEGSLGIKATLWTKCLWAEGSLGIKATLWTEGLWAEGSLGIKATL